MSDHDPNAWLIYQSKHYKDFFPRWDLVDKLDQGSYIYVENVKEFLHQRTQGEADEMYQDRIKNLRPDLHFTNIYGRYIGQFMHGDSQLAVTYQNGEKEGVLGDPTDPESRAWQLENDIDGKGTTMALWQSQLLHALLIYEEVYVLVKSPVLGSEHGPIHWIIIPPTQVTDVEDSDGVLLAVKIEHRVDKRGSLKEEPITWRQVDLFEIGKEDEDGTQQRWEWKGNDTKEAVLIKNATFKRFAQVGSTEQRLPIVRSRMGLHTYMAYLVALSAIALLNHVSECNNRLRIAATPAIIEKKKGTVQGGKSPNADKRSKGWSWLTIGIDEDISFLDVPVDGVTEALSIIEDERKDLYVTTFQSYEDRAREATATEITQKAYEGRIAFLTLLSLRFDPIIQECLFQSEQVEAPEGTWGIAMARRGGPFRPDSSESEAERDLKAFFGEEGLPIISADVAVVVLRQQYEVRGIEPPKTFEEDAKRWYRMEKMQRDIGSGTGRREAAMAAGLVGDELRLAERTDNVPSNGELQ